MVNTENHQKLQKTTENVSKTHWKLIFWVNTENYFIDRDKWWTTKNHRKIDCVYRNSHKGVTWLHLVICMNMPIFEIFLVMLPFHLFTCVYCKSVKFCLSLNFFTYCASYLFLKCVIVYMINSIVFCAKCVFDNRATITMCCLSNALQ